MTKQRQSRYQANPNEPMIFQKRDAEIIKEVFEDQFLTTSQIQTLFFNSATSCKVRLRKLFNQGYLKRAFAPVSFGSSEAIYYPTKKGIDSTCETLKLNPKEINFKSATYRVKPEKQRHEIELNQIKISLIQALKRNSEIELFFYWKGPKTWDRVEDFNPDSKDKREYIPIRPDSFFCLKTNNNYQYFFLELDRGTMRLSEFRRKLRGYRNYFFSGGFLKKYGKPNQQIKDLSFRVLTITPTEERRNNLIEQALLEGSNLMMWFTLYNQAEKDFLGKIWLRGKEYKEVFESLNREEQARLSMANKNRRLERDQKIRDKAVFLSLL